MTAKQPTDAELIAQARAMYARSSRTGRAGDDVEIDDDAKVSSFDLGAYVQAWVWVPYPEPEGDK